MSVAKELLIVAKQLLADEDQERARMSCFMEGALAFVREAKLRGTHIQKGPLKVIGGVRLWVSDKPSDLSAVPSDDVMVTVGGAYSGDCSVTVSGMVGDRNVHQKISFSGDGDPSTVQTAIRRAIMSVGFWKR